MITRRDCAAVVLVWELIGAFLVDTSVGVARADEDCHLSNGFVSLKFYRPEEGGGLSSIRNAGGFEFINRHVEKSLWQIELKRIPERPARREGIRRLSLDPEVNDGVARRSDSRTKSDMILIRSDSTSAVCRVEKGQGSVKMSWRGIDVGGERGVLDVSVTITLSRDDRFARFRSRFENRSGKFTVFYFTAPLINGIYPPDSRTDLDWLASPVYNGRLIRDPITNRIMGKGYRFMPNRSGHSMQFDAYYHNRNGLYLGCFDGMQNLKRYWLAAGAREGFSWGMVHVPNNMKTRRQIWSSPYDTVLRCFEGDWYDACRIYREWALKQSWVSEGSLYRRKSTPKWFKEIDLWMKWIAIQKPIENPFDATISRGLSGLTKGLDLRWWGKGHYDGKRTPERFPMDKETLECIRTAKERNYRTMGLIQGICWDRETGSFQKHNGIEHTVRNFYGQPLVWDLHRGKPERHLIAGIAYPGQVWTSVLGDTILRMAGEGGFDAAYLDSFNHGGTYMNFNPLYGKDSGGGNGYIKDNQKMLREIRNRARGINPEFCFTGESFWEGNMAVLDGFLTCNTTARSLKKREIFAIPMIHTVYHDYTICFGAWASRKDLQTDGGQSYIAKFAQAFVWGVKSSWNEPYLLSIAKGHEIALASLSGRCRATAASRKFLVYGQMLRSPRVTNHVPEVDIKWFRGWTDKYYDISMPAVLHSLWRAPDGSLGLVMYNISSHKRKVELLLDDPEYGLAGAKKYRLRNLAPFAGNTSPWGSLADGVMHLSFIVAPRSPLVFEIELQG